MRNEYFILRVNAGERRAITTLARRLERTQSDALRWLVRNAARELAAADVKTDAVDTTAQPTREAGAV